VGVGVDMVVVVLDRFSCNDVKRLEVVVVQVGLGVLGVLEVLEVHSYRDHLAYLAYLVVLHRQGLLGHPVVRSFLVVLVDLALVEVGVVVGEVVVVGVVHMAPLVVVLLV